MNSNKFFIYEIDFYARHQYRVAERRDDNATHVVINSFTEKDEADDLLARVISLAKEGVDWRVTDIGAKCYGILAPNMIIEKGYEDGTQNNKRNRVHLDKALNDAR
jgi:hypothetical protein